MQGISVKQIKNILGTARKRGVSLRYRFVAYVLLILLIFTLTTLILLSIFNVLNPARNNIENAMEQQLEISSRVIANDMDEMAAYAFSMSEQLSTYIKNYLHRTDMTFDKLKNHPTALMQLQVGAYALVYTNMQLAPCSGGFYILNTTANDTLEDDYYNGLYLKFANLYTENTIHNKPCLFRGASSVARLADINLHSSWQNELNGSSFTVFSQMMENALVSEPQEYRLTGVHELPDTWESARYLYVPITTDLGEVIGICGFEVSDLYFRLSYETILKEHKYVALSMLTQAQHNFTAQTAGHLSGYTPPVNSEYSLVSQNGLYNFTSNGLNFIGKLKAITIGDSEHILAVMFPKEYYDTYVHEVQLKIILILLAISVLVFLATLWLSKKYVTPILNGVKHAMANNHSTTHSHIPEIDDFFEFLAQKDKEHEHKIQLLEEQKQNIKSDYEKAQTKIARLVDKKADEIDPDSYNMFINNLHTLTPKERDIFNYYLDGKTAKDINLIIGINENTIKFHNKNIYSKLGVSSRKQLLQYATLMKQQENTD